MLRLTGAISGILLIAISIYGLARERISPRASGKPTEQEVAVSARAVLRREPLSPLPLWAAAQQDQSRRGQQLAREAVRRNPRLVEARIWLAMRHLERNELTPALSHLKSVYQIRGELGGPLSALLAEVSRDVSGRREVARAFANTPQILDIVDRAAALGLGPAQLQSLLRETDLERLPGSVPRAQLALMSTDLKAGRYREARRVWTSLIKRGPSRLVFDGNFSGLEASPPFNWTVRNNQHVEATPAQEGLRVRAFGDLPMEVVSQHLVLQPGVYVFAFRSKTKVSEDLAEPPFRWEIACLAGQKLVETDVGQARASWKRNAVRLAVPAGCDAQVLRLMSTGLLPQGTPELIMTGVAIEPFARRS